MRIPEKIEYALKYRFKEFHDSPDVHEAFLSKEEFVDLDFGSPVGYDTREKTYWKNAYKDGYIKLDGEYTVVNIDKLFNRPTTPKDLNVKQEDAVLKIAASMNGKFTIDDLERECISNNVGASRLFIETVLKNEYYIFDGDNGTQGGWDIDDIQISGFSRRDKDLIPIVKDLMFEYGVDGEISLEELITQGLTMGLSASDITSTINVMIAKNDIFRPRPKREIYKLV